MTITDDDVFNTGTSDEDHLEREKLIAEALAARRAKTTLTVIDEDGDAVGVTKAGAEIATTDDDEPAPPWPHEVIEDFYGERLEVRKPSDQAMAGLSFAVSKFTPTQIQQNMVSLFVKNHLSPASFERVLERTMDPDGAFTPETIGELMKLITTLPPKGEKSDTPA